MVNQRERQLSRQQADLTHLDATLRLFDPAIRLSAIRPRRQYVRNTRFRKRDAEQPVTTRALTERIMQIKAIPATEARTDVARLAVVMAHLAAAQAREAGFLLSAGRAAIGSATSR